MRDIDGIKYMNDGDWVESCTALVEHHDGSWELLDCRPDTVRTPVPVVKAAPVGELELA